ncbi:MAG: potassium transporter peripheral membrane component [Streptococcaceae bacterium]|jgi:hypothetical protein|nr:potassium transporter peripheral membrane component [Streptococcaceae bacterium]
MDYEKLFSRLNEKLKENNLNLVIICVGGFLMQYYDLKATEDVDAFYEGDEKIENLIHEVGEEFGANLENESWLNNNVVNNADNKKPPLEICKTIYHFSNLEVKAPPLEYILGLKLIANRDKDQADIGKIINYLDEKDAFALIDKLHTMKLDVDSSNLLAGFGEAYGDDWLEEYFINNADKVRKYLR